MQIPNLSRHQGKITSWKEEQGYGFITPHGGGASIFVHIKSFSTRGMRPRTDDVVTYCLGTNEKGQPRADDVILVDAPASNELSLGTGGGKSLAAAGFFILITIAFMAGKVPLVVPCLYFILGAVTFIAYAIDKSAAQAGRWRTQENTLHLLALLGGWPGALAAQQILRHKSKKASFLAAFWLTVVTNCAALGWLLSPMGAAWLRTVVAH